MAYIHHPVVGDQLYGRGSDAANHGLDRQFLHSWSLSFDHPATGEHLSFVDPPTWELYDILEEIAPLSLGRTDRGKEVLGLLERERAWNEASW